MSDEIRVNRPQPAPAIRQDSPATEPAASAKSSKAPWIVLAVVVVVLVVLGVLFRDKLFGGAKDKGAATPQVSGYQAVFLTNGQVYFGKLTNAEGDFMTLKDIYYLQVVQPPLQGQQQPGQPAAAAQQPQISLVKLGNELHGPMDEMKISRPQVLFYESLKEDGQVVQAIKSYKANPAGTPAPAPVK